MASKNLFAVLDSDDEDFTKVTRKEKKTTPAPKEEKKVHEKPAHHKGHDNTKGERRQGARGAARGGRGARTGGRGGRRDFDRRSGTGRGKEGAKNGGGAHNWGNESDKTEQVAEAEAQEGAAPVDGEAAAEAAVEAEEEDNQMSLEEYMEKQKEGRTGEAFAAIETREVANEFEGKATQITKDGKTPDFVESSYERVFTKKSSGRKKEALKDVGFFHAQPERRSYRDDNRDNRGRGGRRNNTRGRGGRSNAPNVADPSAFPALG